MKTIFLGAVAAIVGLVALSAGDSPTTGSTTSSQPGSTAVYAEIASETNCVELQSMFDRADANGKAARARHNLVMAKVTTAYMEAADARMRAIGCY